MYRIIELLCPSRPQKQPRSYGRYVLYGPGPVTRRLLAIIIILRNNFFVMVPAASYYSIYIYYCRYLRTYLHSIPAYMQFYQTNIVVWYFVMKCIVCIIMIDSKRERLKKRDVGCE